MVGSIYIYIYTDYIWLYIYIHIIYDYVYGYEWWPMVIIMDMNGDQWWLTHCIGLHGIHHRWLIQDSHGTDDGWPEKNPYHSMFWKRHQGWHCLFGNGSKPVWNPMEMGEHRCTMWCFHRILRRFRPISGHLCVWYVLKFWGVTTYEVRSIFR